MRRRFTMLPQSGEVEIMPDYCCFKALEDGFYISINLSSTKIDYCIDGGEWKTLASGNQTETVNAGQVIAVASTQLPVFGAFGGEDPYTAKKFKLEGNIMSLLFGHNAKGRTDLTGYRGAFAGLFVSRHNLIEVSDNFLPATTIDAYCYQNLFADCQNLVKGPKILPAMTLAEKCYLNMFRQCPKLEVAPILPAKNLVSGCYNMMFFLDSLLREVTMLADEFDGYNQANAWLGYVSETGVFYKSATATWEEYGTSGIPDGWEVRIYEGE
jgi:hypothetical protein